MSVSPFIGYPVFPLCEIEEDTVLFRHISYVPGVEPQLFLVEQCLRKEQRYFPVVHAQGLEQDSIWNRHLDALKAMDGERDGRGE